MRKLNTKGTYLRSIFVVESDHYAFLLAQPKEDMRKYEVKAISQALQKAGDQSTNTIHIPGINDMIASFAVSDYLDRLRNQANYLIHVFLKARHTFFDYAKREVVFSNDEIVTDEFIRIVKHYAPNEQSAKDLEQYFTTFLAQRRDWFNVPIFLDIHHLTVINREGFNDDPLSHLGDVLPPVNKDRIGKRIPMAHSSFRAEAEHNRDPDADEDPYYFDIDKKMQQNPYSMTNPTRITWGDLTQAVIMAKGSKSDWHYELITGVMVEIEEDRMVVGLDFDHGS